MVQATPTTTRMSAPERRRAIELAAGSVFAQQGYTAARLEDIAAEAGVTKPVVYRHFGSKKALYLALLDRHRSDLGGFLPPPERLGQAPDRAALLRAVIDHWLDYVRENSHAWVMLFRDNSGDEEIRDVRRAVSERAREVFAAFIAAQPDSPVPPDQVEATAEQLRSGLAGLALWWIDHPGVEKAAVLAVAERMSLAAFEPR
jgi:AcrR family transcriptional regulator